MATFKNAILTIKGNELLTGAIAGEQIEFIRLETGSGIYDGTENLTLMEGLKNKQQEFPFLRYDKISEERVLLVAMVSNENLAVGYKMTEVGVYGRLRNSDEEFLCSISTVMDGEADFWPPFNGISPTEMILRYHITISPEAVPCITVDNNMALAEIAAESDRAQAAERRLGEQLVGINDAKVDKTPGKQLSTNDFTNEEKDKLKNIAEKAEVNVQADWDDEDPLSDSFIKNKPKVPTKTSELENDSGYKSTDVKLANNMLTTEEGYGLDARQGPEIQKQLNDLKSSFQDGVDALFNMCVSCGATPTARTPAEISKSIEKIYANRYDTGRTQGQNDVKGAPNNYGLYTTNQYNANYNAGRTQGQNDVKGAPNNYGLYTADQYNANYNAGISNGKAGTKISFMITKGSSKWSLSISYGETKEHYSASADMRISNVIWS